MEHNEEERDDCYLNDFHKEWNEACMKENERILSGKAYSAEIMRAQSQRMDALVKAEEERLREERKNRSKHK